MSKSKPRDQGSGEWSIQCLDMSYVIISATVCRYLLLNATIPSTVPSVIELRLQFEGNYERITVKAL
jgi:hypothetical protein